MQHKYEDKKWSAIKRRDKSYNGVLTTGVFCDPPCPSRQPNKENVQYFNSFNDAEKDNLFYKNAEKYYKI